MSDKKKIRVELRKNRQKPPRENDITRDFQQDFNEDASKQSERVRAKGDLSRRRTIILSDANQTSDDEGMPANSTIDCQRGRVLRVHGLQSIVATDDGREYRCSVRRLLKSLMTDERNIVTTGDWVWFRPAGNDEGMIERVEPRHGVLTRASRRREHVLVANVDQLVIVMSLVEPELKPHLIDRYIAAAQQGELEPIVCLNKCDRIDPVVMQPMIGAFQQLGITTLLTSTVTGYGIDRLRETLQGRATVFSGQSGVGKSSLLNAVQPGLALRVRAVSEQTQKGRHTTTTAEMIDLDFGGFVVDTPGVRQLELWDMIPEEVEGFFPEFRPFVTKCPFPNCTHTHEERCGVKLAVERRQISMRRYHSYLGMFTGALRD